MSVIKIERAGGRVVDEIEWPAQELEISERPHGPAAAALLAGGIGVFVLGLLTTLNEANTDVHDFLEFWKDVGPLSGKVLIATGAFLVSWVALAPILWMRDVKLNPVVVIAAVLIAAGLVGTFPEFFQLFAED